MSKKLMSMREASKYLGLGLVNLRRCVELGQIKYVNITADPTKRKKIRFTVELLEDFIQSRIQKTGTKR